MLRQANAIWNGDWKSLTPCGPFRAVHLDSTVLRATEVEGQLVYNEILGMGVVYI